MVEKKIRHILTDKDIKLGTFAKLLNISSPNFSQQLKRDNFSEKDMQRMADLLNCDIEITFRDRETGKEY